MISAEDERHGVNQKDALGIGAVRHRHCRLHRPRFSSALDLCWGLFSLRHGLSLTRKRRETGAPARVFGSFYESRRISEGAAKQGGCYDFQHVAASPWLAGESFAIFPHLNNSRKVEIASLDS